METENTQNEEYEKHLLKVINYYVDEIVECKIFCKRQRMVQNYMKDCYENMDKYIDLYSKEKNFNPSDLQQFKNDINHKIQVKSECRAIEFSFQKYYM